jgi:integrase
MARGKVRRNVILPIYPVPHLVERLRKDQDRQDVVMSTEWLIPRGGTAVPWSTDAFRHHFAQVRARAAETVAGCRGLRFAELRHTAATRLHEAGATETHISGITGHSPKTVREIIDRHYVVRTEKAAILAFRQRLEAEREEDGNTRSGRF